MIRILVICELPIFINFSATNRTESKILENKPQYFC